MPMANFSIRQAALERHIADTEPHTKPEGYLFFFWFRFDFIRYTVYAIEHETLQCLSHAARKEHVGHEATGTGKQEKTKRNRRAFLTL